MTEFFMKIYDKPLTGQFDSDIAMVDSVLRPGDSFDLIKKEMRIADARVVMYYIDGFVKGETLQKLLAEAVKNNALAAFLADQGCEATAAEFIAALKAQAEEMNDDALDAVSGGANTQETLLSIFSLGVGCAVYYYISTEGSGTGNGDDGRILCDDL